MHQILFRLCSTPDTAGGAYSAPPGSLAGFKGPTSKGREGRGRKGREGKGKKKGRGKGEGGKGKEGSGGRGGNVAFHHLYF